MKEGEEGECMWNEERLNGMCERLSEGEVERKVNGKIKKVSV